MEYGYLFPGKNFVVAVLIKTLHIPIYRFVPLLVCLGFLSKTYQTRTLEHELRVNAEDKVVNQCAQEYSFETFSQFESIRSISS